MRITVILFCLTICLNGLTAKHLVRRSNECQSEDGSDFVCPQSDGMFPHKQCTKFWHCSNCLAYEKDCPSNLYWNDAKQECDWPQNVPDSDCQSSGEAPASTAAPEPTTTPAQETTTQTTSEETTTQGSSDETTTQESNEDTTTQASGEETTTQGSNEETTTQESGEETTTQDSTTTEGSTDETTTEADTTTSVPSTTEQSEEDDTEAPSDPSKPTCKGDQQYYKHSECNKFWQCSNGVAYEMTCAPGTAWDDDLKVCNWPSAVNCQLFHK